MFRQGVCMRNYESDAYRKYQSSIEQRQKVVRTSGSPYSQQTAVQGKGQRAEMSASTKRKRTREKEKLYYDYDLLLVIIFLMCFGLVMLYSSSAYSAQVDYKNDMFFFTRQAMIGIIGFIVMFIVSKIDYHLYGAYAKELFWFSMFLMALVQTPLGKTVNGARRWIRLPGGLSLQPAEFTKIAVILFIAYEICLLGQKAKKWDGIKILLGYGLVATLGVFLLTDNLSTAIIVFAITCILIFVVHPKTKPFVAGVIVAGIVGIIGIIFLKYTLAKSDNFRMRRIIAWLNPEANADTDSYQFLQGLYAIGSGGFFGKGLGNSTQKLHAIPEAQNDMILAVICEELGVFGAIIILCLFAFMLYRLLFIARNAPDLYGALIATGIFAHIALQVTLNIGVVTGLLPTTGVTLPFISYGGTAIVILLAEMGIALGISSKIRLK
ncbi:MAG: FtsW/RodA/SpoVE family cell cycle protein [Mediterraneibacter faecis]|nr:MULTISPECIES: putative peptidoglycan glycosyltransferase FtsW [Mediterraneibacter]MCB5431294.1 putative lipid II flippase FtsW [Mediterraneibacter faecis]MEE0632604.1 putative peptidoglycan glycosyltransferase FtsW [Mediterraneibacter faecis]MTR76164.1 cell division protein FtsW [Mediterraneibacter faecis]RGF11954.1 cell division protein FtsW [Ruminococcus sp. AM16-34]